MVRWPPSSSSVQPWRLIVAGLIVVGLQTACNAPKPEAQKSKEVIRIAILEAAPAAGVLHVALGKHFLEAEGFEPVVTSYPTGDLSLNSLVDGRSDLALSTETPLTFAILADKPIAIFSTIAVSTKYPGLLVKQGSGIATAKDLRGKRIGVSVGTSADYYLDAMLALGGVTRGEVVVYPATPDKMLAAIETNAVDVISVPPARLFEIRHKLGNTVSILGEELLYTSFLCLVSRDDYHNLHPKNLAKIVTALLKAKAYLEKNPIESQQLVIEAVGLGSAAVNQIWAVFRPGPELSQDLVIALKDEARWAIKRRLVKSTLIPDVLRFINSDPLLAVAPDAMTLLR